MLPRLSACTRRRYLSINGIDLLFDVTDIVDAVVGFAQLEVLKLSSQSFTKEFNPATPPMPR
jgi:prophage maintenance system killer protein